MNFQFETGKTGLSYWREKVLMTILIVGLVSALLVFIPMTLMAIREHLWMIVVLNGSVSACAVVVLFRRDMPYRIRAGFTLLLAFVLGFYVVYYFGLFSGGPVCLFAAAVLAGLLLGSKAAVTVLIFNGLTLLVFGWLAATGRWAQGLPFFPSILRGVVALSTYLLMNAITAISAAVLVRGMDDLASREHSANEHLRQEHERLKQEMDGRTRAEIALRESERQYRLLAENASDIIWTLDLETSRLNYVSPSVLRMRGFSPLEVMKQSLAEILAPESMERVTRILEEELTRDGEAGVDPKRSRTLEIQQRNKDGSYTWVEATMSFIRDEQGRPKEILGVTRDISGRKQAEEERKALQDKLQQAEKMEAIATLAGGIAHQFNNALAVVMGRLELIELGLPDTEISTHFSPAKKSAHRMVELTSQLLAYARGGKYQARALSMSRFVRETLPLIEHTLHPWVQVETDLPLDLSEVIADPTQMQMVLSALISNSNEAMSEAGRIRISARDVELDMAFLKKHSGLQPGPYVCLCIEDDGKGMDEETRSRIFEPFFTTHFVGRGLGMASVYGVIENHGGAITVASEPGRGTTVQIYLPVVKETVHDPPVKSDRRSAPSGGRGTVLLIEDDDMVMDFTREMLRGLGFNVVTACSGKEAVDMGRHFEGDIDLAVLDIRLPDMEAKRVYDELKVSRPGLRVLLCSGYPLEGPAQKLLEAGADAFIQKPFLLKDFSEKIDSIFHNCQ